ncbi:SpoIIE family protein phosphatase [Embleya sp. NPDC059237]|uniref:SpoIIE family protein phosphatase n=1 Tax=Embleya sp. NPDC059237 TaxID=3346784 RepID=UPI0036A15FC5
MVGGNWYEIVRLSFGRTLPVMGDVMGHDVDAAVTTSTDRTALRRVAAMDLPGTEPSTNSTSWSRLAPRPVSSRDRPIERVEIPSRPTLGTDFDGYEQVTRDLLPEEILLLYTDGLAERRDQDIDESLARIAVLRLPTTGALDDLLDAVLRGLAPHAG